MFSVSGREEPCCTLYTSKLNDVQLFGSVPVMPRDMGRRAGLSRAAVLSAARDIAIQDGLDKLTIRSLATLLDVAPNAVYGWVDSKAALLDALVDDAFASVAVALGRNENSVPLEQLRNLLLHMFDAMMERPELAPLYLDRLASPGAHTSALRVAITQLLDEVGLDAARTAAAVPVLLVNTLGFGSFMGQTHGAELLDHPSTQDPRTVFARGVDWLLDGITAATTTRLSSDRPPRRPTARSTPEPGQP